MSRDDPARRATGPDPAVDDLPSAEVLDELLRVFSVDVADAAILAEVDLASPEVAELLAAPDAPTTPSGPAPEVEVEPVDALRSPPVDQVEVEVEPVDAGAEPGDDGEPGDGDAAPTPSAAEPAGQVSAETSPAPRTIVIDASEDPPDAVYLAAGDPLLAASVGGRGSAPATGHAERVAAGSVFIDDATVESGETISVADASSATRIEPRLRERRIAVKRAMGRKRLRWTLIVVAVLVVVVGVLAVLGSSLFAIEDVRVDGAVHTDAARLQAVVDDLMDQPVLRADTDGAERDLEAIPWVADAHVTTQFPHGATIELRERSAVAAYQGADGRFRVIDIDGRVLDVVDAQPVDDLLVTSPDPMADLDAGQFAPQGLIAASNLVQSLTPELRSMAGSVSATSNGADLRLELTDGGEVRFGPGRDLVVKLVRLQTKLDQLAGEGFRYLDVSTDDVTTG